MREGRRSDGFPRTDAPPVVRAPGRGTREHAAEQAAGNSPDENSSDDLTAIRGIGIATQDRLYRADLKWYAELARATPGDVRKVLGKSAGGASVEKWIAEAKQLAKEGKS